MKAVDLGMLESKRKAFAERLEFALSQLKTSELASLLLEDTDSVRTVLTITKVGILRMTVNYLSGESVGTPTHFWKLFEWDELQPVELTGEVFRDPGRDAPNLRGIVTIAVPQFDFQGGGTERSVEVLEFATAFITGRQESSL
jgi:hypothetical protein